jgi:hypothetical protein
MWAKRGALPVRPPGARILVPRRRNADDRPNAEGRSDPDDRPNAVDPPNAEGRRDVDDPRDVELREVPRDGDERLKSEPPSSDLPVLELLNPEIRSAELPDLVPPKAAPSPTPEPRWPVSEFARPSLRRGSRPGPSLPLAPAGRDPAIEPWPLPASDSRSRGTLPPPARLTVPWLAPGSASPEGRARKPPAWEASLRVPATRSAAAVA